MNHTNYTSETLRLEPIDSACSNSRESERTNSLHVQASVLNNSQGFQKKKVSSFQITSIRPTSRSSNDGGDDSENDTEDTSDILDSSRVTFDFDQETPSFSEDNSKSEDLIGSGPVIPTSSQYGITALVQSTGTGGVMTARFPQGVTVNVTEGGLALAKTDGEPDDLDNWQKRFKIVKIDSNKPFKRGRWVCLDFMDSPALNATGGKVEEMPKLVVSNTISESDSSEPSGILEIPFAVSSFSQAPQSSASVSSPYSGQVSTPAHSTQVHGGTLYSNTTGQPFQVVIPGYTVPQQPHFQGPIISSSSGQASHASSSTPLSTVSGSSIHSNNDVSSGLNSTNNQVLGPSSVVQQNITHSQPQPPVSLPMEHIQGISLTQGNLISGTGNIPHGLSSQIVGQSSIPVNVSMVNQQSQNSAQVMQQIISSQPVSQHIQQPPTTTQQINQNISIQQISNSIQHQIQQQNTGNQQVIVSCNNVINNTTTAPIFTTIPSTGVTPTPVTSPAQAQSQIGTGAGHLFQSESHQQVSNPISSSQPPPNTLEGLAMQGGEGNSNNIPANATGVSAADDAESFDGLVKALSNVAAGVSDGDKHTSVNKYAFTSSPMFTPPIHTPPLSGSVPVLDVPAAAAASLMAVGCHREHSVDRSRAKEAPFSASTASTVAIDNKIEQAMDLVKSHLMFAVREEVDVLKEKIVELMDRINHLECENNLLRQYASPEVIQQLQTTIPHQLQQQQSHHSTTS